MYDELDKAAAAGDAERSGRIFADLKERFPSTAFAEQGALLAAKVQSDAGRPEAARATLEWAAEHAAQVEYQTIARLRLAGLLLDEKKYPEALKRLDSAGAKGFEALVADRRGDVLMAQGQRDAAKAAYLSAWRAMDKTLDYRRLVEAKLTALGAAPEAVVLAAAGASAASSVAK